MKRLINKILFGLTLTGGSLGLHSCGDWLDINSNELAATKTEAGYLFNYAAINYSSKRVGGDSGSRSSTPHRWPPTPTTGSSATTCTTSAPTPPETAG